MDSKGPEAAAALPPKPVGPAFPNLKRERVTAAVASPQQGTVASTPPASDDDDTSQDRAETGREKSELPQPKRARSEVLPPPEGSSTPRAPVMVADPTEPPGIPAEFSGETPVAHVRRTSSFTSVSSDLSSSSAATNRLDDNISPVPALFPPAPPSTPASFSGVYSCDWAATPLPMQSNVRNAAQLEHQQLLAEGAATPAPTKPAATTSKGGALPEDFSDWAVGDRYELIRILGRGSYGEVAQAVDRYAGRPDAYVAIKRIQSPFEQQVDAVRLYREVHILRRMRGHECIIQLLDVVQPPSDDLDDFNDLYLVFECKFLVVVVVLLRILRSF
jgi:mitogen-activated protein kinase 1/3